MMAIRKIVGWIIIGISAWYMSKWVYRSTNSDYCKEHGWRYDAAADSCIKTTPVPSSPVP